MVRRGRSASPPPATRRSPPAAPKAAPSNVPARAAPQPPAPVAAAPSAVGAPQQPSMFQQMAATAGGVAIGSAVGHTIGHGITSMFSGSDNKEAPAPVAAPETQAPQTYMTNGAQSNESQGPCAWEIKQFLQCAQGQSDITLCEGFNEALRQCKAQHHLQ